MTISFEKLHIRKLHGFRTIEIPIRDNRLVLVGENGTGKSTIANFMYFILTKSWWRMRDYEFESVSFVLNGQEFTISKSDIELLFPDEIEFFSPRHRYSREVFNNLRNIMVHYDTEEILSNPNLINLIREDTGISTSVIRDYVRSVDEAELPLFRKKFRDISDYIDKILASKILYLPTYRRIEKELEIILRDRDLEIDRRRPYRQLALFPGDSIEDAPYMELVQFGMSDVQDQIKHKMQQLKDHLAESLNNLTVRYLREVVFEDYAGVDEPALANIDSTTVENIFSRVGTDLLMDNRKRSRLMYNQGYGKETI